MSSVGGFKMQVQDRADLGLQALQATTENLIAAGSQQPELAGLFTSFRANVPQFYLDLDRTKAKSMEVALGDIFDTL
jgi:multidrug efflux pump subunit AcrB